MRGLAVGGAVCAASALMAYAVRGRSSSVFAPSVYHGSASRPSLALTFDDGPSEATPELLDILREHGVRATFFVCGMNVERLPEVTRAVMGGGHELGNHSWSHPMLSFKTPRFIYAELARTQDAVRRTTGQTPSLFRAPFGVRWFGLAAAQRNLNLLGVMWTVIGLDWRLGADAIAARVMRGATRGGIVCLHDGRGISQKPDARETLSAVRRIIPALQSQGYTFETVSQLLCPTN